ncbi:gamma-glutamyltransferase [Ancylomarina longa]|uniref:Glutathione hydrolase proenzyme n=1 Tax=Ancylomarina longa TaxID=2487017 RepID=A0A434AVP3_9BACT|nr:gamma-glutamyltransferase [Ancylomarina longa]RUT78453.1 gamma-glutamyltransferase [Ancylomarina longa]
MKKNLPLFFLFFCTMHSIAQDRITGLPFASRSEVISQHGMACTSQPLATQVALDILKKGGNAVDAAIAADATLGLMEPTGSGIGGDIFVIIWDAKTKKLYGLNGSGRSPKSLSLEYFIDHGYKKIPSYGPLPVSVPGCVDGWFSLHNRFGSIDMKQILQPAIDYARNGFPVSELISYYMTANAKRLKKYKGFAKTYIHNGKMPQKGDVFKNPYLANTYEKIATGGRDAFYEGEIARTIARYMKEQGGFLTYEDLASHHSEWVKPISINYRGYDIWELPPNGQGTAALEILNILEQYDITSMGFGSTDYLHTFIEAKKLAFEDRAKFYCDPEFADIPLDQLISKSYAKERKQLIDPEKAALSYPSGELEQGNTIYLTVADKEGNMVSLIQSNYRGMGSGMTPDSLGFVLQDRGELFSLEKGHANVFEPGKRPFHTIIPAFITKDGKPYISFGLMGGAMQPQGHAQIVVNLIDFGMNLQEAGDAPRIRHSGDSQPTGGKMTDGGWISVESGIPYQSIRELIKKGHRIKFDAGGYGGYQAILYDEARGVYFGASESRKDGQAAGY